MSTTKRFFNYSIWGRGLLFCILAFVCALFTWLFFGRDKPRSLNVRMPATSHIRAIRACDLPKPIFNHTDGVRIWAIRQPVESGHISPALADAVQFVREGALHLAGAANIAPVPFRTVQTHVEATPLAREFPLFAHDNEAWHISSNLLAACNLRKPLMSPKGDRPPSRSDPKLARALARLAPAGNARQYRNLVENFAKRFDLSTELVMAIIHSESHFSPGLVSNKSAMGLMQLLPSTASDEVHRFLYGRRGNVNFEQLSNPEINIRYGTAYLHILHNRYFSNVRDRQVREACVIASYNLGPNRFLKLYGATNQQAVNRINSMTPAEFHADLPRRLPVAETRYYVEKVKRMKQHYAGLE